MLYADPTLLKLALTNLLANGLKFVPPGVPPTSQSRPPWRQMSADCTSRTMGLGLPLSIKRVSFSRSCGCMGWRSILDSG
jgi:hypothetical protein